MRIFLTGGTGFIGHYVAKELLGCGNEIRILTRHPNKIPSLHKVPGISLVEGSILDEGAIRKGLEGCDACIHIALGWGDTPLAMLENDTRATVFLLEAAAQAGCKEFIYTSSTAAMGKMRPVMTENTVCLPIDLYGATKAAGEAYVLGYHSSQMKRNVIRPGYTFGNPAFPDGCSQPDRRFLDMAQAILGNRDVNVIKNDGTQFIHAGEQAKVFRAVLESQANEEVYLALGKEWISWKSIAQKMLGFAPGSKSKIVEKDIGWADEPMMFSVEKISAAFGFAFNGWDRLEEHIRWQLGRAMR